MNQRERESDKQKIQCDVCHNARELDEQGDNLICSHCSYSLPEKKETIQQREDEYQHLIEEVNNMKIRKAVTFDYKNAIHSYDDSDQVNSLSRSFHSLEVHDESSSDDEEQERLKEHENQLREAIKYHNHQIKAERKVIVGSGFTFDMTDFFSFKKRELGHTQEESVFDQITGSRIAWVILLYTICSSAFIPGWIMNIKANKFLRQCWRFLMQALMVIPFVFYQRRTASPENKLKYCLDYILKPENLVKPFVSSLAACLWFLFILTSFEWTQVSHGIVLGNLSNFFLSLNRSYNKNSHDLELGGQVLILLGIALVVHDSLTIASLKRQDLSSEYLNFFFMGRTWWERLGGDLLAIGTSLMTAQISKFTSDLRSYYPPFLSMLIVNIFNVFNLTFISFFFNGTSFDNDTFWGIFSVFSDEHFVSFMYMAIVLAFGQMVSVVLITRMFPDPIIPALAMTLEPFMACLFVDVASIQSLPQNFCMVGFILIFPGMFLVLMGQCFFQRQKSYQEQSDERVKHLLREIRQLKDTMKSRETHMFLKHHHKRASSSNSVIQIKQDYVLPEIPLKKSPMTNIQ